MPTTRMDAFPALRTREPATTFGYDSADRVVSTTTPAPGTGQPAQVTQNVYTNVGTLLATISPDGGVVNYEYYKSGELARTLQSPERFLKDWLNQLRIKR